MNILKERIQQHLQFPDFFDLTVVEEIASTNATVKEWGLAGKKEGAVLLARRQTAGRGRLGRSFFSPETGIYFSLLLRPDCSPADTLRLTTAAAVAVAQSIGENARIKWVNDVFLHGKKVCGILTESALMGDKPDFAVLGIGLNLTAPAGGFPQELQEVAGGIFETLPTEEQIARFISDILTQFYNLYQNLFDPAVFERYQSRHLLQGKTVTAGAITGRVIGLTPDFALLLQNETGQIHTITAGEATIGSTACEEIELC